MQCPVCAAPATNRGPDDFDGVEVDCPRCGGFQVAGTAVNGLLRKDIEQRSEALQNARQATPPGAMPTIDTDI